uniref:Uncharacterized protein n=1 Tax=Romanomermis culicivorax TaxID=13658 RepID=A0A915KUQ1_ROMCU
LPSAFLSTNFKRIFEKINVGIFPTIRVSIDLPRNQKTFLRLNADSTLEQVLVEIVRRQKDRLLTSNSPHILENFALKSLKRPDLVLNLRKSLKETGFVDFKLLELQADSQKSNDVFYQYTKMDLEDKKRGLDCGKSLKFFSLFKKKPKKEQKDKKRGLDCGKSLKFFSLFKKKPKKEK